MKPNIGQGDKGESQLFGSGKRFPKDSTQFEALGILDELNSLIGYTRSLSGLNDVNRLLKNIQSNLFEAQANLAVEPGYNTNYISDFKKSKVEFLEEELKKLEKDLPELENFILPGGSELAALLHMCRSKTRTAERRIVAFSREQEINSAIRAYINRLADVFFALARYVNQKEGIGDTTWKQNKNL